MAKRSQPRSRIEAGRSGREPLAEGSERLLALETATRVLSVALLEGEKVRAEVSLEGPRVHSERILPVIDQVLEESGTTLDDIGAFAVSVGPGSFTGLRIGLATVKGLVFGRDLPVLPVPTLAGFRQAAAGAEGPVAALMDARRGEFYAAAWDGPGVDAQPILEASVYRPLDLASQLPEGTVLVAGEGAAAGAAQVAARWPAGARIVGDPEVPARAAAIGRLGLELWRSGASVPPEALVPRYLRRAEAEVQRTGEALEPVS